VFVTLSHRRSLRPYGSGRDCANLTQPDRLLIAGSIPMAIHLDHTIVPARDKVASATFFARIFGLAYNGPHSHFAPVQVNRELTLDFDERGQFEPHHYAF